MSFRQRHGGRGRPTSVPRLNEDSPQARGLAHWFPLSDQFFRSDFITRQLADYRNQTKRVWLEPTNEIGTAVQFGNKVGGTQDYKLENLSFNYDVDIQSGLSVSFWMRIATDPLQTHTWNLLGDGTSGEWLICYWLSDDSFYFQVKDGTGSQSIDSGVDFGSATHGRWYQIVYTDKEPDTGFERKVYIDGDLKVTHTAGTYRRPSSSLLTLGGRGNNAGQAFAGHLKDFRIYNRVINQEEVTAIWTPKTRWDMWWAPGRVFYSLPVAGTTHDKTVTDSLSLADTASETAAFSVSTSETLNLADAGSELADFVETLSEALSLADTASGTTAMSKAVTEALNLSDSASETATFAANIAESLSFLDTATRTAIINRSLAETLNFSDTASGTTGIAVSVDESLSLADTASEIATFMRSVSENLSLTDTAARTWSGTRTAAGVLSFADAASAVGGEAIPSTKGGLSLSEKRMRELERLQMLQRDDDEIVALIARLFR